MQFSGFLEASDSATSTEELFQLLGATVSPLGYYGMGFFALTTEAQVALATCPGLPSAIIASNYPTEYIERYKKNKYHEIDPVLAMAKYSLAPLVYDDIISDINLSNEQIKLVSDRVQAGLYGEVACPIHGPRGRTYVLCFTRIQPGDDERAAISALQVLSLHFYYSYVRVYEARRRRVDASPAGLADGPPMPLTEARTLTQRERECLLWTARGKSASTISVILHLSENTINFYVKNAMRKLGTTNRVVAVVLAVRAGLIQP